MEPAHDFGREAMERLRLKKEKEARIMKILKISGVAILVTLVVFFVAQRSNMFATGNGSKGGGGKQSDITALNAKQGASEVKIIKKWELPEQLKEISGLSYLDNGRYACVQDEEGKVFIYNTATSKIEKEISFAGPGDYEGLAMVNGAAWVLRSDGKLFEVDNINAAKPVIKEYSTLLTAEQDTEGLCYDPDNNRLLLAVKDEGKASTANYKGIYPFDLATKKMPAEPVFRIDLEHEVFDEVGGKKKKSTGIMPSAIAIHPVTKDMYITEGRKAKLLVTDAKGVIKKLYQLDNKVFEQPEGITISPGGEIFISNEGVKLPGNIIKIELAAANQ